MHFRLLGVLVLSFPLFIYFLNQKLPSHSLTSSKAAVMLMRCLQNSLEFWEDWQEKQLSKIILSRVELWLWVLKTDLPKA